MTAIELLPLPRQSFDYPYAYDGDDMENYALDNVAHTTARLQAEIEALRAEVVKLRNMRNDMNNEQSASQKAVAWARPVNAPDTGEWN